MRPDANRGKIVLALKRAIEATFDEGTVFFRSSDRLSGVGDAVDFGWGKLAAGGIEVNVVPGDHVSMFEEPNVGQLAERLLPYLRRSMSG